MRRFGGYGYGPDDRSYGYLSDLWTNFTGLRGSIDLNRPGVRGQKFVPSATNWPSARYYAASWSDRAGNGYIFGGYLMCNGE